MSEIVVPNGITIFWCPCPATFDRFGMDGR